MEKLFVIMVNCVCISQCMIIWLKNVIFVSGTQLSVRQGLEYDHKNQNFTKLNLNFRKKRRKNPFKTVAVVTHLDQHLGTARFKCSMCDEKFYRKIYLDYHFERTHEIIQGKHKCSMCDFKTHSRTTLAHHLRSRHRNSPSVSEKPHLRLK